MSSSIKRRTLVLARYNRACYVLVLIPFETTVEVLRPSNIHLLYLAADVVLALWAGLVYRIAARRWMDGSDD